jgi:glycine/D-amino acid oxidase-like deaminating enzyme
VPEHSTGSDHIDVADTRKVRSRTYSDQPTCSPWLTQLGEDAPSRPLDADATADVVVVGAGIAGVATAFFTLRDTNQTVLLVERDRVARGATGRNAGQLTTYFERPLCAIADEFGVEQAVEAQRAFDSAHDLLDLMVVETGASVRVERFMGHMGMFGLQHLQVHLRNNLIRRAGGWRLEECVIAEDADFRREIPREFDGVYQVVPRARVQELLEIDDARYCAVLSDLKGCVNSGLLAQQVLAYLLRRYAGRLRFADQTHVTSVTVAEDRALVRAHGYRITAGHVVLCTNGFVDHVVHDASGSPVRLASDQQITGLVGHMTAFFEDEPREPAAVSYIRNTTIGGKTAYVYVTRRTYDHRNDAVTLTCMGGPEAPFDPESWDPGVPFPGELLAEMDDQVRPFASARRAPGLPYDFHWHGLMAYNDSGIRVVGAHPRHPALLYNLGCNGVGFLPSIFGGQRVSELLAGHTLAPSIFDPR